MSSSANQNQSQIYLLKGQPYRTFNKAVHCPLESAVLTN
jgi:hypothetical protein